MLEKLTDAVRSSRKLRILLAVLGAVLVLFIVWRIIFLAAYSSLFTGDGKVWNIFLIGADNNNTGGMDKLGNADGEIILSVNRSRRTVTMTSVLRDTFLKVEGAAVGNKATLLYHFYGPDTLIAALEQNLGITIDNHAVITYPVLIDAVDMLGGVEAELSKDEIIEMNAKIIQLNLELFGLDRYDGIVYADLDGYEGTHTFLLTGKQAAGLSRVRLSDATRNDLGRTERERSIVLSLKDRFAGAGLSEKIRVVRYVLSNTETDISAGKLLAAVICASEFSHYRVCSQRIPVDGSYYDTDGYIYMDTGANRDFFRSTVYGEE